jgi:hypothetical protein
MAELTEFNEDVRVEYSLEALIATAPFENLRPGYKIAANVRPGEHPNKTRERLKETLVAWILEDIDEARK